MIPNTQPLNFLASYSLVGIGKFNLLFLWIFGGVGCGQPCSKIMSKGPTKIGYPNELTVGTVGRDRGRCTAVEFATWT